MRVGVTGYAHEVNGFASPVTRAHGIEASRTHGGLAATWEAGPAIATLVAAGVEPVDLPVWEFGASGPLDGDDFRALVAEVDDALVAAGPLDAVLVLGHGAGRTTDDLDPDATFLRAVRRRVGPVPVVVVLDFHANVTPAMCASVDGVVGYRTNPHVDIAERVADAAAMVVHLLGGGRTSVVAQQVPMVLPQIAQLTASHEPFGEVMLLAEQALRPPMRNVSVFGGFSLADVACQGASVCVTVDRGDEAAAIGVVRTLAAALWSRRDRYRLHATPLDEAIAVAARAAGGDGPPVLLADVADNPGGGAPATSTHVLRALLDAGVTDAVLGLQCDRRVVDQAWAAGVGTRICITFNRDDPSPLAPELTVDAEVLALVDAPLVPSRGVYVGARRHPGRCAALRIGGVDVGVSSAPVQVADPDTLEHAGLRPAAARVTVVKSRGHFRAGFAHLFADDRIVEVGAPGVATPELHTLPWRHLRRPVFPLDDVEWDPTIAPEVHRA
ncbi:MAG: M81 family metallopeptidase [Acidimicrobiales bacterium]|nr:M81 family metallopeptidase [Acidimicrobiales bacterium]MCB9396037.1 M81 family metallopeptidase [Acidimicrobiaceae bacterium]